MHITQIETITGGRGRARVYLDGTPAFILYRTELRELALAEDTELSDELYRRITEELLPKRATARAMHLLAKRPYTEMRLRDKLAQGEYPDSAIEAALAYVRGYGYLDDLRYAADYADYRKERVNRNKLRADLLARGVAPDIIEEAFALIYGSVAQGNSASADAAGMADAEMPPQSAEDAAASYEEAMIRRFLEKKHYDPESATYEERAALQAALIRKGFSVAQVSRILTG